MRALSGSLKPRTLSISLNVTAHSVSVRAANCRYSGAYFPRCAACVSNSRLFDDGAIES
jgi:hypothetical protein